jgi:spermidine synthase
MPARSQPDASRPGAPLATVAALLSGSGLCALIYQVAWQREFRLIFGSSTAASAAVLAIFMGGIGAGSIFLGRLADRHPRPLALYANLEGLIAIFSALTPTLLHLGRSLYIALGGVARLGDLGGSVARLLIAAVVILPATFLMGGTLPAATRAAEASDDESRRRLGLVYGCNTLGAVAGGILATFVLLEILGTRDTIWFASLVNALVAVVARVVARRQDAPKPAEATEPGEPPGPPALGPPIAAAAVGFAFFLMELVWYRMLAPLFGGTVFAFGSILVAALFGIGLGGLLYPALARRFRSADVGGFAILCTLEALLILLPFAFGDRLAVLVLALRPLNLFGFSGYLLRWTVVCLIAIVPGAAVSGIQFPWLVAMMGHGVKRVGRHVGLAYACNTAGAVLGALAGGFGLLPWLSARGCWMLAGGCLALLGLSAMLLALRRAESRRSGLVALALLVPLVPFLSSRGPTVVWTSSEIGIGRVPAFSSRNELRAFMNGIRHATLWARDGVESSVSLGGDDGLSFVVNGKSDGNAIYDADTQVMGGVLGALLRPAATRALVIGLGTGSTAGWLAAVPRISQVDVAELEPSILDVARECRSVNRNALENPRVHVHLGDARELILTTRERYGIIFSEPSNPYRPGVASLFTKDFYDSVSGALDDDGILVQWVQGYEVDNRTVRSIYSTLSASFPHVETWQSGAADLLLVASKHAHPIDLDELRRTAAAEPFASALRVAWKVSGAEGFLSHSVAGPSLAPRLAEDGLVSTDDQNLIEYGFARTMSGTPLDFELERIRELAKGTGEDRPEMIGTPVDWGLVERARAMLPFIGSGGRATATLHSGATSDRAVIYDDYMRGALDRACGSWKATQFLPTNPFEWVLAGECLAFTGDASALDFAAQHFGDRNVEGDVLAALVHTRQGQVAESAALFARAFIGYRDDPWAEPALMHRALTTAQALAQAHPEEAARLLESLRQPFAAHALDRDRQSVVFEISSHLQDQSRCQELAHQGEPDPSWAFDYLQWRHKCYAATQDPLEHRAAEDLETFLSDAPTLLTLAR